MTKEVNYEQCSICEDYFPEDSMEVGRNGKLTCIVCETFNKKSKSFFAQLFNLKSMSHERYC